MPGRYPQKCPGQQAARCPAAGHRAVHASPVRASALRGPDRGVSPPRTAAPRSRCGSRRRSGSGAGAACGAPPPCRPRPRPPRRPPWRREPAPPPPRRPGGYADGGAAYAPPRPRRRPRRRPPRAPTRRERCPGRNRAHRYAARRGCACAGAACAPDACARCRRRTGRSGPVRARRGSPRSSISSAASPARVRSVRGRMPFCPGGDLQRLVQVRRGGVGLLRVVEVQVQRLVDQLPARDVVPVAQRDRGAVRARAAGAADAVQIGLLVLGRLVVDHVGDVVDVDTAGGDVRAHQYIDLAVAERAQRLFAGALPQVAVDRAGREAAPRELLGDIGRRALRAAEDHRQLAALGLQDPGDHLLLVHGVGAERRAVWCSPPSGPRRPARWRGCAWAGSCSAGRAR